MKTLMLLASILVSAQSWAICCKGTQSNGASKALCGKANKAYKWIDGNTCTPSSGGGEVNGQPTGICCFRETVVNPGGNFVQTINGQKFYTMTAAKCLAISRFNKFHAGTKNTCP